MKDTIAEKEFDYSLIIIDPSFFTFWDTPSDKVHIEHYCMEAKVVLTQFLTFRFEDVAWHQGVTNFVSWIFKEKQLIDSKIN